MRKIKLLFDLDQLNLFGKGHSTGLARVADELFKRLYNSSNVELYPCITGNDFSSYEFLELHEDLKHRIVRLPSLKKTILKRTAKQRFRSKVVELFIRNKYHKILKDFDWYFSPFTAISDVVYTSGIKTAIFVHDLIPIVHPEFSDRVFAAKYASWMKGIKADLVFCNSTCTKMDFLNYRQDFDHAKCIVSYLAADSKFHPNPTVNAKRYFISVSQMSKRKNFKHLLDAFLQAEIENTELYLVGPMTDELKELVKDHPNVKALGFVSDEELVTLYSNCVAFVYPSLYEGFGLPILEAMSCGAPVITANNSSLPEVGGDAILYISGTDIFETSDALKKIARDVELQNELRSKGLTRASEFSWDRFTETIVNCLLSF